jgi:transcriptional regulator with XRE-family HTH domain
MLVLPCTAFGVFSERFVMNGDKVDSNMNSIPAVSLFRGIYNRVAKRLGVDPSYVSRVARGERKSAVVEKALAEEVRVIRDHLNNHNDNHNNNHAPADKKKKSKIKSRPAEPLARGLVPGLLLFQAGTANASHKSLREPPSKLGLSIKTQD